MLLKEAKSWPITWLQGCIYSCCNGSEIDPLLAPFACAGRSRVGFASLFIIILTIIDPETSRPTGKSSSHPL